MLSIKLSDPSKCASAPVAGVVILVSLRPANVGAAPEYAISIVSPVTVVVIFEPPCIVSVSVVVSASAIPLSPCTKLNAFWLASPESASPA